MDEVKAEMNRRCDVGGVKCSCCNPFRGKDKSMLARMVRRVLRIKIKQEARDE